jgi:hypothetical protein
LRDLVDYLSEYHEIPIGLGLSADGELPITTDFGGRKLKHALALLLDDIKYKATLQGDAIIIEPQQCTRTRKPYLRTSVIQTCL